MAGLPRDSFKSITGINLLLNVFLIVLSLFLVLKIAGLSNYGNQVSSTNMKAASKMDAEPREKRNLKAVESHNVDGTGEANNVDKVKWYDDFLGSKLHPAYSIPYYCLPNRKDCVKSQNIPGGWYKLTANYFQLNSNPEQVSPDQSSSGRIRLGDDPTDSAGYDLNMPFTHALEAVGRTRVAMDTDDFMNATIGFVGPDDPQGVAGALLYRFQYGSKDWWLQTCNKSKCTNARLDFLHEKGVPFDIEIRLSPDSVEAWINGKLEARSTEHIPTGGAAWEYQVWGYEDKGEITHPSMYLDYLHITQKRAESIDWSEISLEE